MKTNIIVNGGITMVMEPENTMEEEILKALVKQESSITDIRGQVMVLSKQIRGSVLICKKNEFPEFPDSKSETQNPEK